MKRIFIATGYNSWTNKDVLRAFSSDNEANSFIEGLTNPKIQVFSYKSTLDLVNALLKANPCS